MIRDIGSQIAVTITKATIHRTAFRGNELLFLTFSPKFVEGI
jgi:hypothetical protein